MINPGPFDKTQRNRANCNLNVLGGVLVSRRLLERASLGLEVLIVVGGVLVLSTGLLGYVPFAKASGPFMSPFTAFSLMLMAGSRMAERLIETWSKPMTLAIMGIVACGNISSILMLWAVPELYLQSMPTVVPTSIMTSTGLILFCFYEILVVIRRTPDSVFILDDILLLLALFPGGLSLLGHVLDIPFYMSSQVDPRAGISILEMLFMGAFATVAVITNPHLFLWRFLAENTLNRVIFFVLFLNQFALPIVVGLALRDSTTGPHNPGLEFFVMLAGLLATLTFLIIYALGCKKTAAENESPARQENHEI